MSIPITRDIFILRDIAIERALKKKTMFERRGGKIVEVPVPKSIKDIPKGYVVGE